MDTKQLNYIEQLKEIKDELDDEVENLIYLLEHQEIEDINLININYRVQDLIIKKENLRRAIYEQNIKGQ